MSSRYAEEQARVAAENAGTDDGACSCGKHYGIGKWSPGQRAKNYRWLLDNGFELDNFQEDYLETWNENHKGETSDDKN